MSSCGPGQQAPHESCWRRCLWFDGAAIRKLSVWKPALMSSLETRISLSPNTCPRYSSMSLRDDEASVSDVGKHSTRQQAHKFPYTVHHHPLQRQNSHSFINHALNIQFQSKEKVQPSVQWYVCLNIYSPRVLHSNAGKW